MLVTKAAAERFSEECVCTQKHLDEVPPDHAVRKDKTFFLNTLLKKLVTQN